MTSAATTDRPPPAFNESDETVLPPQDSTLVRQVEAFLEAHSRAAALIADGQRMDLPDEVFTVLNTVVQAMARGEAVTVAPVSMQLTTSQAAELLGISRQTLVRLLDSHAIPYEQPRRHRLLRLTDVLAYKQRHHVERRMASAGMTRQAQEDGLYEDTDERYAEALKAARADA
ncbi:MAG: excisionase family DNA-binding protein [Propionibacteriaceae bacterium]|jgi:excisionase family DNA binding protein|nr:excisionase family DNA-binding protein [Propionibacteriaceae bacterium]